MKHLGQRCASEAVGTFLLVLFGAGSAMVNVWTHGALGVVGVALAFAFVVTAVVTALAHVSGAHINPAVTIALWTARRFPAHRVIPYIAAQCTGAVAASALLRLSLGDVGHLGATLPALSVSSTFTVEFVLSWTLMLVILGAATDHRAHPGNAPLAIGLTVGLCALVGGPLTGASMNPARSFGPAVVGGEWDAHWIYWVAPVLGMIAAVQVYRIMRRPPDRIDTRLTDA